VLAFAVVVIGGLGQSARRGAAAVLVGLVRSAAVHTGLSSTCRDLFRHGGVLIMRISSQTRLTLMPIARPSRGRE